MRILWTANTLNQYLAEKMGIKSSHSISWVEAMSSYIKNLNDISLAIAVPGENGIEKKIIEGITYYAVPSNVNSWSRVIADFQPDIIHEYGTEKEHNLLVYKAVKNIPVIVSLQGILAEYQKHYYAGIDMSTILKYSPLRDWIRPSGFITGRLDFEKRSINEINLLKKTNYVEGRSTWDRVAALKINPNLKYYYCPRMLRKAFNEAAQWNVDKIDRHTILISQGNYPIKGLHFAFMAIAALKIKYPDVKLIVTGTDMFANIKGWHRFFRPGYVRYLYDLSKKLDIFNNIRFAGLKDADGMVELYKSVHVALVPSAIENAPNSLAEAMILGTPSIASFVGGNMDMLEHNVDGFLYCYNEPYMLVEYITRIFESDDLAKKFSNNARIKAKDRHNPDKLLKILMNIYNDIILNYNKNN